MIKLRPKTKVQLSGHRLQCWIVLAGLLLYFFAGSSIKLQITTRNKKVKPKPISRQNQKLTQQHNWKKCSSSPRAASVLYTYFSFRSVTTNNHSPQWHQGKSDSPTACGELTNKIQQQQSSSIKTNYQLFPP